MDSLLSSRISCGRCGRLDSPRSIAKNLGTNNPRVRKFLLQSPGSRSPTAMHWHDYFPWVRVAASKIPNAGAWVAGYLTCRIVRLRLLADGWRAGAG